MAQFARLPDGEIDDRLRLVIDNNDVTVFEQYELRQSFFTAPNGVGCRIGSGETTVKITNRFQPNKPYQARIGSVVQQSGRLDGYTPEGSAGATEVNLRGRDAMAILMSAYVTADRSFSNASYVELVGLVLQAVGIKDFRIRGDNVANRLAIAGATGGRRLVDNPSAATRAELARLQSEQAAAVAANPQSAFVPNIPGQSRALVRIGVTVESAPTAPTVEIIKAAVPPGAQAKPLQAKVGQKWWDFLHKELSRAGLFLFAGQEEGVFILGQPAPDKAVLYDIVRQRGAPRGENVVNVISARHHNETAGRFSHYIVHGRGGHGTRKAALTAIGGDYVDQEMVDWGFYRPWCHPDSQANNDKRAAFLARRKAAEDRRQGWSLVYTVKGHTAPLVGATDSTERVIWAVDTVAKVRDDELGLYDFYWVESVVFRGGSSGRTTEVTLCRPDDLVFGEPDLQ